MNGYLFMRRIRGPVLLLTFGVTALLAEWDILSFSRSWPLYLIVFGVMRLAEGAMFAAAPPLAYPAPNYTAPGYSAPGYGAPGYGAAAYAGAPAVPGSALAVTGPAPLQNAGYNPVSEPHDQSGSERES